jgi:hypothetical protein
MVAAWVEEGSNSDDAGLCSCSRRDRDLEMGRARWSGEIERRARQSGSRVRTDPSISEFLCFVSSSLSCLSLSLLCICFLVVVPFYT